MNTVLRALALGVVTTALAAGCTSSSSKPAAAATAATRLPGTPTAARSAAPTLVQGTLPSSVANNTALRPNVVVTKCAAIPGGWGASGTVKNPGATALTYTIVVYFTTTSATTLSFAQATVRVAPGQTTTWTAAKKFPAMAQMLCPVTGISAT